MTTLSIPIWCHPTWRLIHALSQSTITSQHFLRFLYCLSRLIPCEECSYELGHTILRSWIKSKEPLDIADQLHDGVRRRLGQPICSEEAKREYRGQLVLADCYREFMAIYELQYQSLEKRHFLREVRELTGPMCLPTL